ncbi:hypothetical protein ACP70R_015150 [Stipagrostis hirtigluma subsp. patula]
MEPSGGAIGAKRAKGSSDDAGEDRLSTLPDDVLVLILLCLDTAAAGRTSVLSRRWRRVWRLLPELRFPSSPEAHLIASALVNHEAALRHLLVEALDATTESVATWLPLAAQRLSGGLVFQNRVPGRNADGDREEEEEEAGKRGVFELPCLENATAVSLDLGFLILAVPSAGVFSRLTELSLSCVRFHGPCELGNAVSSPRCPTLQKLSISDTRGLVNLTICSESLLKLVLRHVDGLRELTIAAPKLKELKLLNCFCHGESATCQPVANISTPQLVFLVWRDTYDPGSVQLGSLGQLEVVVHQLFSCIWAKWFKNQSFFSVALGAVRGALPSSDHAFLSHAQIGTCQYLMKDLTVLPRFKVLTIFLHNKGHAFGASLFHILRMCTRLKALSLVLRTHSGLKAPYVCPSGCVYDGRTNWKTKDLTLNRLQEVVIIDMEGTDHEIAFVKRLFSWATVLKRMRVIYSSRTASKAKEVHHKLTSLANPETHVSLEEGPCE